MYQVKLNLLTKFADLGLNSKSCNNIRVGVYSKPTIKLSQIKPVSSK